MIGTALDVWLSGGTTRAVAAILLTFLAHSALLLLAAAVLAPRLRASRLREAVWRAALFGGLLTAGLASFAPLSLPRWRATPFAHEASRAAPPADEARGASGGPVALALPTPAGGAAVADADGGAAVPADPATSGTGADAAKAVPAAGGTAASETPTTSAVPPLSTLFVLAWAVGATALVVRLVRRRRRLAALLADRARVTDPRAIEVARRLARALGLPRRPRLSASPNLPSPVALGADEVCLPARALDLPPAELEGLLAHELAHLARRDPRWLARLAATEVLLFPQPLVALAARRLREEAELRCDELAADATGRPLDLARSLASVAAWLRPEPALVGTAAMARADSLVVRRVRRLLDGAPEPVSRRAAWLTGTLGAALLGVLACAGPAVDGGADDEPTAAAEAEPEGDLPVLAGMIEPDEESEEVEPIEEPEVEPDELAALSGLGHVDRIDGPPMLADLPLLSAVFERDATTPVLVVEADGRVQLDGQVLYDPAANDLGPLVAALEEVAEAMPAGDPDESLFGLSLPDGDIVVYGVRGAPARSFQKALEACARAMIWRTTIAGEWPSGVAAHAVPLPRDVHVSTGGEGLVHQIEVRIDVLEAGAKVDPETGAPWSGEGRFAFDDTRDVRFETVVSLGSPFPYEEELFEEEPSEEPELVEESPLEPEPVHVDVAEEAPGRGDVVRRLELGPDQLAAEMEALYAELGDVHVTIDPRQGTVYSDVIAILDATVAAGFTGITFVGAYE